MMARRLGFAGALSFAMAACGGEDAAGPVVETAASQPDEDPSEPEPERDFREPELEVPAEDPPEVGLDPVALEAAAALAESLESYCLLVFHHDELVLERYWQGHDANTPERSWSLAKSYTSALVGIAIDNGDLGGLDDSVALYLPEWQGSPREAITLRHLVTMQSGLEWSAWDDYVAMTVFSDDHTAHALALEASEEPESAWTYHNGAVQVLEAVFRNATGVTIEAYAETHLWSKLGMNASWAHDPAGHPTAYASVMASCRDHAKLGKLYRDGGKWEGVEVVPADWVASTLTPSQPHNRAYGQLWWLNAETPALDAMGQAWDGRMVPFAPPDLFAARGFGNQFIDVIPSLDLIVVRFGTDPMNQLDLSELFVDAQSGKHDQILSAVLAALE